MEKRVKSGHCKIKAQLIGLLGHLIVNMPV